MCMCASVSEEMREKETEENKKTHPIHKKSRNKFSNCRVVSESDVRVEATMIVQHLGDDGTPMTVPFTGRLPLSSPMFCSFFSEIQ